MVFLFQIVLLVPWLIVSRAFLGDRRDSFLMSGGATAPPTTTIKQTLESLFVKHCTLDWGIGWNLPPELISLIGSYYLVLEHVWASNHENLIGPIDHTTDQACALLQSVLLSCDDDEIPSFPRMFGTRFGPGWGSIGGVSWRYALGAHTFRESRRTYFAVRLCGQFIPDRQFPKVWDGSSISFEDTTIRLSDEDRKVYESLRHDSPVQVCDDDWFEVVIGIARPFRKYRAPLAVPGGAGARGRLFLTDHSVIGIRSAQDDGGTSFFAYNPDLFEPAPTRPPPPGSSAEQQPLKKPKQPLSKAAKDRHKLPPATEQLTGRKAAMYPAPAVSGAPQPLPPRSVIGVVIDPGTNTVQFYLNDQLVTCVSDALYCLFPPASDDPSDQKKEHAGRRLNTDPRTVLPADQLNEITGGSDWAFVSRIGAASAGGGGDDSEYTEEDEKAAAIDLYCPYIAMLGTEAAFEFVPEWKPPLHPLPQHLQPSMGGSSGGSGSGGSDKKRKHS